MIKNFKCYFIFLWIVVLLDMKECVLYGFVVEIDRMFNLVDCYLIIMLFINLICWGKK